MKTRFQAFAFGQMQLVPLHRGDAQQPQQPQQPQQLRPAQRVPLPFLHRGADDAVLSCFADLFCSKQCLEVDTQAKSASVLRRALYERERGVCRLCGLDAAALGGCCTS